MTDSGKSWIFRLEKPTAHILRRMAFRVNSASWKSDDLIIKVWRVESDS